MEILKNIKFDWNEINVSIADDIKSTLNEHLENMINGAKTVF